MIASLAACFDGGLAPWRDMVSLEAPEDAMPGAALLDRARIAALVGRFGAAYPGADPRSVVSLWSQFYFAALVVPYAAALLVAGRSLPVALGEMRLAFHPDGRPSALILRNDGTAASPERDGLAPLIEDHAEPLIRHLAAQFAVAPRLLWCNFATYLDWTIREIGPRAAPDALTACRHRLAAATGPDGRRNPIRGALTERSACGEAGSPCRRICCLRYLLPGTPGCGALCPIPEGRA